MRGTIIRTLARAMRRAALLSTLSLLGALAIALGGFLSSPRLASDDFATTPEASPTAELMARAALSGTPRATAEDTSSLRTVVPLSEQAFEATREASADVVRAARADSGAAIASGTPSLATGDRVKVSVSFYYCRLGSETPARGDGGGFCGAMRDGSVVYNGAAACDYVYLGQRFRIEGDPLKRVYRCADTGSAVHGLHRDIWFASSDEGWNWQRNVGQAVTIEILP